MDELRTAAGKYISELRGSVDDHTAIREFARAYIEANQERTVPCISEVPFTEAELTHLENMMIQLTLGSFTKNSFLGCLVDGDLTAVVRADPTDLRAIRLLMLFDYNEATGLRR